MFERFVLVCLFLAATCADVRGSSPPPPTPSAMGIDGFGFGPGDDSGGARYWISKVDLVTEAVILTVGETKVGPPSEHAYQSHSRELEIRIDGILAVNPKFSDRISAGQTLVAQEESNGLRSKEELDKAFSPGCVALWRYDDGGWKLAALGSRKNFTKGSASFETLLEKLRNSWSK